jgi:hypothetical protein
MFVHKDHPEKQKVRENLKKYILKTVGTPKSMLTLSADNFIFESYFNDKTQITSCENNSKTYRRALKNKPDNITLKYKNIFDEKPLYEVIWLDLCVNLSVKTVNELISYFQRSNAIIISVTLQSQREWLQPSLSFYGCSSIEEFRITTFPNLIYALTGYKLTKLDKYRTNLNMSTYTFKKN